MNIYNGYFIEINCPINNNNNTNNNFVCCKNKIVKEK